jgi:ATP-binding cassette, subfamily A (ABC1), member 3
LALLNTQYMIGASITASNITAWFNNEGFHTPPLATNMMYNAQLRTVCPDCELRVGIDPLPFTTESEFLFLQAGNNLGFQLAFNTGFAMSFVGALFVLFYVRERVSRSKLLQFVSGTNIAIFWTVSFLWDFLMFTIGAVGFIIILAAFQEEGWSTFQEVGRFFLLLWFFGFGMLPLTYLGSFLTDVPSTGMTRLSMFYVFTGIIAFMAVFIIGSDLFDLKPLANTLGWIFLIFPHYAMAEGISNLNVVSSTVRFCNRQCELIPFCTQELMCNLFPDCCGE